MFFINMVYDLNIMYCVNGTMLRNIDTMEFLNIGYI